MSVEGREPRQTCADNGKKVQSPNCSTFKTKLSALIRRAKTIHDTSLRTLAHLIDKEWLNESWKRLRKGAAYGIDAVSEKDYASALEDNLSNLLQRLREGQYKAPPVKRIYIPKTDGKLRPLGLPTVEDKIAQNAVGIILTAIYEQEFLPMSYGFRVGRNAHQAVEGIKASIAQGKVSWVLDVDIQSFFDTINHKWLMKFVEHRIADKRILSLISRWLKAGVMEEGKLIKTSSGSPQGGVISPILANIYLHYVIDLWVTKVVSKYMKGQMYSFRYADDILFCFQYRSDAIKFQRVLKKRLEKFNLQLNEEKTTLCRFGRYARRDSINYGEHRSTFNYLGFTFYNGISRSGKYKVGCRTQSKRLNSAMNHITAWCRENRHQAVSWQARYFNAVLQGHYNYYGVTGNFPSVAAFYRHVIKIWHRYLSRRSQRAKLSWEKYMSILKDYPLIKPHIPHSVYAK